MRAYRCTQLAFPFGRTSIAPMHTNGGQKPETYSDTSKVEPIKAIPDYQVEYAEIQSFIDDAKADYFRTCVTQKFGQTAMKIAEAHWSRAFYYRHLRRYCIIKFLEKGELMHRFENGRFIPLLPPPSTHGFAGTCIAQKAISQLLPSDLSMFDAILVQTWTVHKADALFVQPHQGTIGHSEVLYQCEKFMVSRCYMTMVECIHRRHRISADEMMSTEAEAVGFRCVKRHSAVFDAVHSENQIVAKRIRTEGRFPNARLRIGHFKPGESSTNAESFASWTIDDFLSLDRLIKRRLPLPDASTQRQERKHKSQRLRKANILGESIFPYCVCNFGQAPAPGAISMLFIQNTNASALQSKSIRGVRRTVGPRAAGFEHFKNGNHSNVDRSQSNIASVAPGIYTRNTTRRLCCGRVSDHCI